MDEDIGQQLTGSVTKDLGANWSVKTGNFVHSDKFSDPVLDSNSVTNQMTLDLLCADVSHFPALGSKDVSHYIHRVTCPLRPCAWKDMLPSGDGDGDLLFILKLFFFETILFILENILRPRSVLPPVPVYICILFEYTIISFDITSTRIIKHLFFIYIM